MGGEFCSLVQIGLFQYGVVCKDFSYAQLDEDSIKACR